MIHTSFVWVEVRPGLEVAASDRAVFVLPFTSFFFTIVKKTSQENISETKEKERRYDQE